MGRKITTTQKYMKLCLYYGKKYNQPEVWKRLIYNNEETRYLVSNYGRIYDDDRLKVPTIDQRNKHYFVSIRLEGRTITTGVYRLVAIAFIDIPEVYIRNGYTMKDLVVDHIRDGDPDNQDDNTIWNLQWLRPGENTIKALDAGCCKYVYPREFRDRLNAMILEGYDNDTIYDIALKEYGYDKKHLKSTLQIKRRRLGVLLKEHHENDPEFVAKVDKLLKKGYSNDEIIDKLGMSREGRASARLLQYRRSILKIPAAVSKYFDNEQSKEVYELFDRGYTNEEIIEYFHYSALPYDEIIKIKKTLNSRRCQYNKKKLQENNASSETIENII